jgi:hypothetical protein
MSKTNPKKLSPVILSLSKDDQWLRKAAPFDGLTVLSLFCG